MLGTEAYMEADLVTKLTRPQFNYRCGVRCMLCHTIELPRVV